MGARLARDPIFWAALLAGPLVVWGLAAAGLIKLQLRSPIELFASAPGRIALVVLAYPVVEEWLFRGIIQPAISERLKVSALPGISAGNFHTSLLFALAHLIQHPPALALATFFPSLVFGFFRDRYASIVPAVVLHVAYNYCWFSAVA
ncbi:MAG: JDVT-CTERM system glutamic-type intramembrane protease [Burkholderiales bacterium]